MDSTKGPNGVNIPRSVVKGDKPKQQQQQEKPQLYADLNWDEIDDDSTVVMFGPRGCGKTRLIYRMLLMKKLRRGIIKCGSAECWVSYGKWMSKSYIYQGFFPEKLKKVMGYQNKLMTACMKEYDNLEEDLKSTLKTKAKRRHREKCERLVALAEKNKADFDEFMKAFVKRDKQYAAEEQDEYEKELGREKRKLYRETRNPYCMFLVLDDLGSDGSLKHGLVKVLVNNGRHYGILLVFAIQNPIDLPSQLRQGICWLFLFYETKYDNLLNLWKKYASSLFRSIEELRQAMQWASDNGGVLVLHVNHPEQHLKHRSVFFWKKINLPDEPVPIGSPEFLAQGNEFFDEDRHEKMKDELLVMDDAKGKGKKRKNKGKQDEEKQEEKEEEEKSVNAVDHDENDDGENDGFSAEKLEDEEKQKVSWMDEVDTIPEVPVSASAVCSSDGEGEGDDDMDVIRATQKQLRKDGRKAKRDGDMEQDLFTHGGGGNSAVSSRAKAVSDSPSPTPTKKNTQEEK